MNESIDIAFASAKVASASNKNAHLAVLGMSMGYNFGQMARYRYLSATCQNAIANVANYQACSDQVDQYNREMRKHFILGTLDVFSCLIL